MQDLSDNSANKREFTHYPAETCELLLQLETLDQSEDAPARVALIERLLKLVPQGNDPSLWSELQMRLGSAYEANAGTGNQRSGLRQAIACYDAALTIYNPETTPDDWARAQLKKGDALRELAELEGRARQARTLRTAVACYDAALTFYTREASPLDWARTQDSKGVALCQLAEFLAGRKPMSHPKSVAIPRLSRAGNAERACHARITARRCARSLERTPRNLDSFLRREQ